MHKSIQIIKEEHASLSAMLQSMGLMIKRGPEHNKELFFKVLRAMLFYIDEFPEKKHHPKESTLLFAFIRERSSHVKDLIDKLEIDHKYGEYKIRELEHLLIGWEMLGDKKKVEFEHFSNQYINFYMQHMQLEESLVIPEALKVLTQAEWDTLDKEFALNLDPLNPSSPRQSEYDHLFSQITQLTPAPIGFGDS